MSISRGILQRALRSNNGSTFLIGAVVLLALLTSRLVPVAAQQSESHAFLLAQPQYRSHIVLLPANSITAYEAEYRLEETPFRVYVAAPTDETLGISWGAFPCALRELQVFQGETGAARLIRWTSDRYVVYVAAPIDAEAICAFVDAFITDFSFFLSVDHRSQTAVDDLGSVVGPEHRASVPQFPAVLPIVLR